MLFPSIRERIRLNEDIHLRNDQRRDLLLSYVRSVSAGMFVMWQPLANDEGGLPSEIGEKIGSYLSKSDADKMYLVCKNAQKEAQMIRNNSFFSTYSPKKEATIPLNCFI